MEPIMILLVNPLIALIMLRADHQRLHGLDPQSRDQSRMLLKATALAMAIASVISLSILTRSVVNTPPSVAIILLTMARSFLVVLCLSFLVRCWQISEFTEHEELPLAELVRRDRIESSGRMIGFLIIILPLAIPAIVFSTTFGLIPLMIFAFTAGPKRIYQNQLLWTLAVGVKSDCSLGYEVDGLIESLRPRRPVLRTLLIAFLVMFLFPIGVLVLISVWRHSRFLKQLSSLASSLHNGMPLHSALTLQPGLLGPDVLGAIESAEQFGTLKEVLPELAVRQSQEIEGQTLTSSVTNVMLYSWMVIGALTFVTCFLMYWIIPKYKDIFHDFGIQLPPLTEKLIIVADWFANYWYLVGPLMLAPLLLPMIALLLMFEPMTWIPERFLRLMPRIETPMLLKRLASVVAQNFPMQVSLQSLANSTADFQRARRLERIKARLDSGSQIGPALQEEGYLNTREALALHYAESIGNLNWAMNTLARAIESRRILRYRWMAELFKPLIVLSIGLLVAGFTIAMFLPLLKLINDLS